MAKYEVIVGDVGIMQYDKKKLAYDCYNTYVELSKAGIGDTAGQDVTLIHNVIIKKHTGIVSEPLEQF